VKELSLKGSALDLSQDQIKFLENSLPNFNEKTTDIKLIYRASRDGWAAEDFHKFCDNKGATLILLKADNGRRCGGYTSVKWESDGGSKNDDKSFLFQIESCTKYKIGMYGAIWHYPNRGPQFGNQHELRIGIANGPMNKRDNCESCTEKQDKDCFIKADKDGLSPLTGMASKFTPAEIEVYLISS
jgi:hypothetical protein